MFHQTSPCAAVVAAFSIVTISIMDSRIAAAAAPRSYTSYSSPAPPSPQSSRDDGGVTARAEQLLQAQATENLPERTAWAERIKLGDPHKYIIPTILAKLHRNSQDKEAIEAYRWIINVDKAKITTPGDRGIYHFAVMGKARLFFSSDNILPADILDWFQKNEGTYLSLFRATGTENHQLMSRTSGYLFAERFEPETGRTGDPKSDHLAYFRKFLRDECKKLYTIGQGEWDSSTYVTFSVASWANIYDFAKDTEMREIARAALDWYSIAYGLKYFHGLNAGPEARGFATAPVGANSDVMAWLWFGGAPEGFIPDLKPANGAIRYSIIPALSAYRPDPIVARMARKEVHLPFTVRASKPEYYDYYKNNYYQEVGYYTDRFAMGTLYDPTAGDQIVGQIWPQTTQFKLSVFVPEKRTTVVFGAGNPYHRHFPVEGRSPYDQYHQVRGAMVNICDIPDSSTDNRAARYSLLAVPALAGDPAITKGWYTWQIGETYIAARPLGASTHFVGLDEWSRRTQEAGKDGAVKTVAYLEYRWLQTDGALCGWVIDTGTRKDYATLEAFTHTLQTRAKLDLSRFASEKTVIYTSLQGDVLRIHHTSGLGGKPEVWGNGKKYEFTNWPVYDSPYVKLPLQSGVLTVSDGKHRMIVDFSGELPVWRYE